MGKPIKSRSKQMHKKINVDQSGFCKTKVIFALVTLQNYWNFLQWNIKLGCHDGINSHAKKKRKSLVCPIQLVHIGPFLFNCQVFLFLLKQEHTIFGGFLVVDYFSIIYLSIQQAPPMSKIYNQQRSKLTTILLDFFKKFFALWL